MTGVEPPRRSRTDGVSGETEVNAASDSRIAVLIPCYNEAQTIARVVKDFRSSLPQAAIYVYDNNSSDGTAEIARAAGAVVRKEIRQGKGYVVRRMFADIDADVYLLVDGDATYEAAAAPRLVQELLAGPYDKVNGARVETSQAAYRSGHALGNKLLSGLVALVFGAQLRDMLSGYKAFSRRFVKTFPSMSSGFEIETELLIHSLEIDAPTSEIETAYRERPPGSFSKLSTYKDGVRILWLIVELVRDLMPLHFFSAAAALLAITSLALGVPIVNNFVETGLVPRLPTAVLSLGLMLLAFMALFAGLTLDSVARGRRETKLLAYLGYAAPRFHSAAS
jgi:glycosyltransferase involved in cell wall biosynthesis